jgi:hypothetical protein
MDHQAVAQLFGNYGEFVGGVAVLFTIVYLAIQVRHGTAQLSANTAEMKTAALSESYSRYQNWTEVFFSDPSFMDSWVQGLSDPTEMAPSEQLKFRVALSNHVWLLNSIRQASLAAEEVVTWEATLKGVAPLVSTPGFRTWWVEAKHHFPADLVAEVEKLDFNSLPGFDYSGRVPDLLMKTG